MKTLTGVSSFKGAPHFFLGCADLPSMVRPALSIGGKRSVTAVLLFLALCAPLRLAAEVRCRAEVSYQVALEGEEQPRTVYFARVSEAAEDEPAAREALAEAVARSRNAAMDRCRRDFQDLAGCLRSRLSALNSSMSMMSFSARKALEEAVAKDCGAAHGRCGEVTVSEPACAATAEAAPEETAEKKEEEKGGKGKKR